MEACLQKLEDHGNEFKAKIKRIKAKEANGKRLKLYQIQLHCIILVSNFKLAV